MRVPPIEQFQPGIGVGRKALFKTLMRVALVVGLVLILVLGVLAPMPGGETGVLSTHDKFTHEIVYAGLAVVGLLAGFRPVGLSLGLLMHGAAVELLQSLTLFRTGDWFDLLADASGVAVIMLGRVIVLKLWKW